MEAPDIIYFDGNDRACKLPIFSSTNIEYIRKDAFIEKLLKYLDADFYFNYSRHRIECAVFDSKEEMIEDFKKYIEDII